MDELGLFTAALGLSGPWRVVRSEFDAEATGLDLYLGFERGARFGCPAKDCAQGCCGVHDTVDKTWRHLDFFQYTALLHARLPRVRCPDHGVRQVDVPWARPGSGFTLLSGALVLTFAAAMPISKVAAMTREHGTRIWRIVEHHVNAARDQLDLPGVTRVGMDETSARKGQDYISIFADLDARRVMFATEGRCAGTVGRFRLLPRVCRRRNRSGPRPNGAGGSLLSGEIKGSQVRWATGGRKGPRSVSTVTRDRTETLPPPAGRLFRVRRGAC